MSPKVLRGAHAEDVGDGRIVEPGQELPANADPSIVRRLVAEGKVEENQTKPTGGGKNIQKEEE